MNRYSNVHRPLLTAALFLPLLLAACDRNRVTQVEAPGPVATATPSDATSAPASGMPRSSAVADASITTEVRNRLATDSGLAVAMIEVETLSGRTSLKGKVADGAARDRAGQLAAAVTGVEAVDNRLEVSN